MNNDEPRAVHACPSADVTIDRLFIERAKDIPIAHTISKATSARQKGALLGYAQTSLVALRRNGTIYADDTKRQPLFTWHAKLPFMAANQFTVTETSGDVLAMFGKTLSKTFRSASFNLVTPDGIDATGRDAGSLPGVVKVFSGHQMEVAFCFQLSGGTNVLRIERGWNAKDPYIVICPPFGKGRHLDWRVAAAMTLVMDVTLNRSSF
ncbi:MAG: hypothetical protein FWD80_03460 [Propionibacteriaceae bacterium]|nr:hypothetical protein [Propionibacteriaceae bacterium]